MYSIKGTIIGFIPKQFQSVPNIQDLLSYYSKEQVSLDDDRALGMNILDDDEKTYTVYASVSLVLNTLNHLDKPLKIKNRVAIDYDNHNFIKHIKVLPVFFERNQEHDTDKTAPAFIRRGSKQNDKAQPLLPFNPLLAVPNNLKHKDNPTTIFSNDKLDSLKNTDLDMKDVFMSTLHEADFDKRSQNMFKEACGQTQSIIDLIFHHKYLKFNDSFNHIHSEVFHQVDDKNNQSNNDNKKQPNIRHINL